MDQDERAEGAAMSTEQRLKRPGPRRRSAPTSSRRAKRSATRSRRSPPRPTSRRRRSGGSTRSRATSSAKADEVKAKAQSSTPESAQQGGQQVVDQGAREPRAVRARRRRARRVPDRPADGAAMNKAFTPIGLVVGLAAGQLAKKIFDKVWGLVKRRGGPAAQAPRGPRGHDRSSRCSSRARSPASSAAWSTTAPATAGRSSPARGRAKSARRRSRWPPHPVTDSLSPRSRSAPGAGPRARRTRARDRPFQTLKRTMTEFSEDNLTDSAAALTYYAVLSIFPALLAMISIVGLVGDPQTIIKTLTDVVSSIGPASAVDTFKGPIEGLTKSSGTAGIMVIVGIAGGAVDRVGLRRRVHARGQRHLRGRGGPLVHQAAPAADARDARCSSCCWRSSWCRSC